MGAEGRGIVLSSRNTGHLYAGLHQLETVSAQMFDPVADCQSVGHYRLPILRLIRLRFLELMHRVDATFGVSGMKLSDEN